MFRLNLKVQVKGKHSIRRLSRTVWFGIAFIIVGIVLIFLAMPTGDPQYPTNSNELKAVIIDQLYTLQSNDDFIQQVTEELEDYGFKVEFYKGDEVTVGLYKRLPLENYQLIIFRAHSGALSSTMMGDVVSTGATYLFTDEAYVNTRYRQEQLTDQVLRARITEDSPEVFAVGAKFVSRSMQGRFPNTVIIMMGCSTMHSTDLAEAFTNRGVSAYLGWNGPVNLDYVDEATLFLLENLCHDMSIKQAVTETNKEVGPDPEYMAYLKYYPTEAGDKNIDELIN
ncbi:hypothetical protein ACFLUH_01310 [Chloroflexota bacterium]